MSVTIWWIWENKLWSLQYAFFFLLCLITVFQVLLWRNDFKMLRFHRNGYSFSDLGRTEWYNAWYFHSMYPNIYFLFIDEYVILHNMICWIEARLLCLTIAASTLVSNRRFHVHLSFFNKWNNANLCPQQLHPLKTPLFTWSLGIISENCVSKLDQMFSYQEIFLKNARWHTCLSSILLNYQVRYQEHACTVVYVEFIAQFICISLNRIQ